MYLVKSHWLNKSHYSGCYMIAELSNLKSQPMCHGGCTKSYVNAPKDSCYFVKFGTVLL